MLFAKIYCSVLPEIALFGTDVATDWVNGYNLIVNDDIIWGTLMCVLPLLPMATVGPVAVFEHTVDRKWYKILAFLILYIPFVMLMTPVYIGFILFTGALKLWDPDVANNSDFYLSGRDGEDLVRLSSILRITEIVTESCPQSMLGEFILCASTAESSQKLIDLFSSRHLHPTCCGPRRGFRCKSSPICRPGSESGFPCKRLF